MKINRLTVSNNVEIAKSFEKGEIQISYYTKEFENCKVNFSHKVTLHLEEDGKKWNTAKVTFPLQFLGVKNEEILIALSILIKEKPEINYEYFQVGDTLYNGNSVFAPNAILKSLTVNHPNSALKVKLNLPSYFSLIKTKFAKDNYKDLIQNFFEIIHQDYSSGPSTSESSYFDETFSGDEQMQEWYNFNELN